MVELLPGEELHLAGEGLARGVAESLGDRAGCAADMAVGRGLKVDGGAELQAAFDGGGAHVENLIHLG